MNIRKDDFQISLFGLPKCHFEFSQDDIDRMKGFEYNFERLIRTDFIKQRMNETPVVFVGNVEKIIPEALWADFNEKFRHFILQKDPYNYPRVRRIAFRHPSRGPTMAVRQMDRMIDHQEKIAHDAYENDGMFDFRTSSGKVISAFEPTYRPFGAEGTLTRRILVPCLGQVTMSESIRTAPTPNFGITASIDFRL
jgi:hypothetical protein